MMCRIVARQSDDLRIAIWQAASVLPGVGGVLETLLRADAQPVKSSIVNPISQMNWCGCRELHPIWWPSARTSEAGSHSALKSQPQPAEP